MTTSSHTWPRELTARRRWTPVTEATLQAEFEEAHDRAGIIIRPARWWDWQTARTLHDARVIRTTKEGTA